MTSGMVNSSNLPDRPSLRGSFARGTVTFGCSSVAEAITAFELLLFSYVGPARRAVKSRFNNTRSVKRRMVAAVLEAVRSRYAPCSAGGHAGGDRPLALIHRKH